MKNKKLISAVASILMMFFISFIFNLIEQLLNVDILCDAFLTAWLGASTYFITLKKLEHNNNNNNNITTDSQNLTTDMTTVDYQNKNIELTNELIKCQTERDKYKNELDYIKNKYDNFKSETIVNNNIK